MKRICIFLALILSVAFFLVGCGGQSTGDGGNYKAGTYTATTKGHNGDLTVEVKFTDDAIESIDIVEHSETEGLGDEALNTLSEEIVSKQSLNVDTVSGATVSSEALIKAVGDCVEQAGGDIDALKK